jgi:hypothetical protein
VRRSDLELLAELVAERLRLDVRLEIRETLAAERESGGEGESPCRERLPNVLTDHTDTATAGVSSAQERARAALRALRQRTRPEPSSRRSTQAAKGRR